MKTKSLMLFKKRKPFFYRLTAIILLLSLIPTIIVSISIYYYTQAMMQKEITSSKTIELLQTVNSLDMLLQQIDSNFNSLTQDKILWQFVNFSHGYYLEKLNDKIDDAYLIPIYNYLENKKHVLFRLETIQNSNSYIQSVYLYDIRKDLILTSQGLQYSLENFYDQDWTKRFSVEETIDTFQYRSFSLNEKQYEVLTFSFCAYDSFLDPRFLIAVNIDFPSIYNDIFQRLLNEKKDIALHVFKDNTELFGSGLELLNQKPWKTGEKTSYEVSFLTGNTVSDQKILKCTAHSKEFDWNVSLYSNYNIAFENLSKIRNTIVFIIFIFIGLILLFSILSIHTIYEPVKQIIRYIQNSEIQATEKPNSEMEIIFETLKTSFQKNNKLEKQLINSLPIYQENLLLALLQGHIIPTEVTLEMFHEYELHIPKQNYLVLSILITPTKELQQYISLDLLKRLEIRTLVNLCFLQEQQGFITEKDDGQIILILHCTKDKLNWVFKKANDFKYQIEYELISACCIGIGRHYHSVIDLPKSYNEAVTALNYSKMLINHDVVYVEDVEIPLTSPFVYSQEIEKEMIIALTNAQQNHAQQLFRKLLKQVSADNPRLFSSHIQQIFLLILGSLVKVCSQIGININNIIPELDDLNNLFMIKNDLQGIHLLDEIIVKICNYISDSRLEKGHKHVNCVIQILESNCIADVSLNSVAEELNLNPAYLSRIFKETTGNTFVEYLTELKMNKAKNLLVNTTLTLQQISEEIGYSNSYYFIKIFKKYFNITPGAFRKNN